MLNKYILERDLAAIGEGATDTVTAVIERARRLFSGVGTQIVWLESFTAGDKTCSVFLASEAALVHAHARASGYRAYKVTAVRATIAP